MTVGEIMKAALLQLGEDAEDIGEFRELFLLYLNEGYAICINEYLKPREKRILRTDANGMAGNGGALRVIRVTDERGRTVKHRITMDGRGIITEKKNAELTADCQVTKPILMEDTDEPSMPENAQLALTDYICARQLGNGNLAQQKRAAVYEARFYQTMRRILPEGCGSVTAFEGLYEATRRG